MFKIVRARYERGVLRLLEPGVRGRRGGLIRVDRIEDRRKIVEEYYGKRGAVPKELLDRFMFEAETQ